MEQNNCDKHKKEILGCSDMKQLAEMIGDLHYETLSKLLINLSFKIQCDESKDRKNKRIKLADSLGEVAHYLKEASFYTDEAWRISKPFMNTNSNSKS